MNVPEYQSPARLGAPDERLRLHFSEVWSSMPPTPCDTFNFTTLTNLSVNPKI
jgi:hypothetical protein